MPNTHNPSHPSARTRGVQMEEEAATGSSMRELGMAEREELLDALKSKWDEANAAYQRITFKKISTSNSTIGEIRWKEQCERTLAQLEKEIERLSVKGPIYVVDDGAAPSATAGAGRRH
ncbi:hypothetical protein EON67_04020 [archaeon]|nr:MAG: hypothetical protein EON67_04020 [archaeon]